MFITVAAQKGEQAKSTTAVNLMAAFQDLYQDKFFRLVDLDDQQCDTMRFVDGLPGVAFTGALPAQSANGLTVVDTAPSVSKELMSALVKSDLVIIPCTPATLSLEALARTFQTIRLARDHNSKLIARVLFTRANNTQNTQGIVTCARALSEWPVFETIIPNRHAEFERAAAARVPAVLKSPRGAGSVAYRALAKEVQQLFQETK